MARSFMEKHIIYCPNCRYEGPARVVGTRPNFLKWWVLALAGFLIEPLLGAFALTAIWLAFKPAQYYCPQCDCELPVYLWNRLFR